MSNCDDILEAAWFGALILFVACGMAAGFAVGFWTVWQAAFDPIGGFLFGALAGIACAIPGIAVGGAAFLPVAGLILAAAAIAEARDA